jgi:hypothetical protein
VLFLWLFITGLKGIASRSARLFQGGGGSSR